MCAPTISLLTHAAPLALGGLALADLYFHFSRAYAGWPFLLSLVLVGMPHGAIDLLVAARLHQARSPRAVLASFTPYLILMGAAVLILICKPALALIAFAALSVLHFSLSDFQELRRRVPHHRVTHLLSAISRSVIVLALPFATSAPRTLELVNQLLTLVGSPSRIIDPRGAELFALAGLGLAGLGTLFSWASLLAATVKPGWIALRDEVVEMGGLFLGFLILDPLFAAGVYFLAWHSLRHVRELCVYLWPGQDFERLSQFLRGILRIHLLSLPLLVPTLIAFGCMVGFLGKTRDATELALLVILIFVVVTLPHHVQVQRMFASKPADLAGDRLAAAHQNTP